MYLRAHWEARRLLRCQCLEETLKDDDHLEKAEAAEGSMVEEEVLGQLLDRVSRTDETV